MRYIECYLEGLHLTGSNNIADSVFVRTTIADLATLKAKVTTFWNDQDDLVSALPDKYKDESGNPLFPPTPGGEVTAGIENVQMSTFQLNDDATLLLIDSDFLTAWKAKTTFIWNSYENLVATMPAKYKNAWGYPNVVFDPNLQ